MSSRIARAGRSRISGAVALLMAAGSLAVASPAAGASTTEAIPAPGGTNANVAYAWNVYTVDAVIKASGGATAPPVGARYFAIVSTCVYDAWAAYDATAVGTRLGGTLRQPAYKRTAANRTKAVNYAAHRALVDLFPAQKNSFDAKLSAMGGDPANNEVNTTTPAGVAHKACDAVLDYRHTDGANQLGNPPYSDPNPDSYEYTNGYMDYDNFDKTTVVDPYKWAPIRKNGVTQKFIGSQFPTVKPFAMRSVDDFLPPAPPAYNSAEQQAAEAELINLNANLTDKQKVIAEHWIEAAISPTGHQNEWAQFVSRRDQHTLDEDVKMFFGLNLGMGDAGIAIRNSKKHYDIARPISTIRYDHAGTQMQGYAGPGQGTQTIDGGDWKPYISTPAFPAYVSGHSTWGATAAEYLKLWTGSDAFGDSYTMQAGASTIEPGTTPAQNVTLRWNTFSQAAEEDGMSRLYGGVHWRYDKEQAQVLGIDLARNAHSVAQGYFNGQAPATS